MLPKLTGGIYRCIGGVIGTGLFLGSAVSDVPCYCIAKPSPNFAWTNFSFVYPGCHPLRRPCWGVPRIHDSGYCRVLVVRINRRDDSLPVSDWVLHIGYLRHEADEYCRPNVGGVVGLADLYVDPALGFSLGWAAWVSTSFADCL